MKVEHLHPWDVSLSRAREIQEELRTRVIARNAPGLTLPPRLVAGVDVSCPRSSPVAVAGVVVMQLPSMRVVERRRAAAELRFPYVPGYLSFREGEAVTAALRLVRSDVDVILFDGQGICHPRRFGLACHVGVLVDRPSVGCAKSLLLGSHREPALAAGSRRVIRDRGEAVGLALRTRRAVRPVYVSVGHLVDLPTAAGIVLRCCRGVRLPEPQREAHRWVTELGRGLGSGGDRIPSGREARKAQGGAAAC